VKSGLKSGRADHELDEIARSMLADEGFDEADLDQMAHLTEPLGLPMISLAELAGEGLEHEAAFPQAEFGEMPVGDGAAFPVDYEERVRAAFAPDGALARATSGFVSRPAQIEFALAVADTLKNRGKLLAEAGTGTGKTFAYLTPALIASCRVIVSTAGKSLQEQLCRKDIPILMRACGLPANVALLKGRSNYLCRHRIAQCERGEIMLASRSAVEDFRRIRIFLDKTKTGDVNEIAGVAEDSVVWPSVTSTAGNCLGKHCKFARECFVTRARLRAQKANVIVVNHHLFLSAAAMELEGGQDDGMLPRVDAVIFDEAHKLPEIATNYFGSELSTAAVREIVESLRGVLMSKFKSASPKDASWDDITQAVKKALYDFVLALEGAGVLDGDSRNIETLHEMQAPTQYLENAAALLEVLLQTADPFREMSEDLSAYLESGAAVLEDLKQWVIWLKSAGMPMPPSEKPLVRWLSRTRSEARLTVTPLDIAEPFARMMALRKETAWVFTSATMAVGEGEFGHFTKALGITGAAEHAWHSPFDYGNQAMLYVPPDMPNLKTGVSRDEFTDALIDSVWPVVDMVQGRAFVLCTSYRGMERAAEQLRERIAANGRDYTVLVQREEAKEKLLDKFRTEPHPILVATMSFWEGIDIKGDQLSLVVIDKLPFPNRDDPVFDARCKWLDARGESSFHVLSVPAAAIALKQGTGRLIRSEADRGILIIGDVRMVRSGYGQKIWQSLPPYTKTMRIDRVIRFWKDPEGWE
jgi:putative ATP-dependent helicase